MGWCRMPAPLDVITFHTTSIHRLETTAVTAHEEGYCGKQ